MQIVAQRTPLLEVCKLAEKAVPARPVNAALCNLLVQAREGCFLTAMQKSVGVRLPFPAQIEQPGQALIPAKQFLGILRESADGELIISSEPDRVVIRGDHTEFVLRSDDASRFPQFPPCPPGPIDELASGPLHLLIQRTRFAVGKNASGHSIRGALWEIESDRVRLVATDNLRLAVAEMPAQTHGEQPLPRQALVPVEAMQVLERLAAAHEGPIQALFRPREVFFRSGGAILCATLLSGAFPPWRKAMQLEPRYRLLLPVGPFLSGVKQAAVLRDRTANRVLLRFQGGRVTLRSRQPGTGRATVQQTLVFPCAREPIEVAFNPAYLTELLQVLDAEATVQLDLRDPDAPALFSAGDSYKHVLMPLRRE